MTKQWKINWTCYKQCSAGLFSIQYSLAEMWMILIEEAMMVITIEGGFVGELVAATVSQIFSIKQSLKFQCEVVDLIWKINVINAIRTIDQDWKEEVAMIESKAYKQLKIMTLVKDFDSKMKEQLNCSIEEIAFVSNESCLLMDEEAELDSQSSRGSNNSNNSSVLPSTSKWNYWIGCILSEIVSVGGGTTRKIGNQMHYDALSAIIDEKQNQFID